MPVKIHSIIDIMERLAPSRLALSYDNVGLILGDADREARRVMAALDLDDNSAREAVDTNADLLITHHPPIFKPINRITADTALGRRLMLMIKNGVSVYAAHTNLDIARMGTNDALFVLLGLSNPEGLIEAEVDENESLGRIGILKREIRLGEFCGFVKEKLGLGKISYTGDPEAMISKVALCTGSASDYKYLLGALAKKCDVYITGDVTYHNAQAANDLGIAIIDGTHFATEALIVPELVKYLGKELAASGVDVYASNAVSVLKTL